MDYCNEHTKIREDIGAIKNGISNISESIKRLDTRINGSFEMIGKHIEESPYYRDKINRVETEVKIIKEEKLNSIKNSQYRIAIIVSVTMSIISLSISVILRMFFK